jgi:hypothetical protein
MAVALRSLKLLGMEAIPTARRSRSRAQKNEAVTPRKRPIAKSQIAAVGGTRELTLYARARCREPTHQVAQPRRLMAVWNPL